MGYRSAGLPQRDRVAERFVKRPLVAPKYKPRHRITGGLNSDGVAQRESLPGVRHRTSRSVRDAEVEGTDGGTPPSFTTRRGLLGSAAGGVLAPVTGTDRPRHGQVATVAAVQSGYRFAEPRIPPRVLVIERATGEGLRTHGHPWAATTPLLCSSLIQAGFEVQVSNNLERVKNPNDIADGPEETDEGNEGLPYFDAVVFHGKIEQADREAVQALVRFVEGGKGLVVLHIASASFAIGPDGRTDISEDWKNLLGSIWVYGVSEHPEPPRAVTVRIRDAHHPVTAGLPAEFTLAKEELYSFETMAKADGGPGHVLAEGTTYDSKAGFNKTDPVAFALERGGGRVLNVYLGHFISTYRDRRFQKLITQGVEWAARR